MKFEDGDSKILSAIFFDSDDKKVYPGKTGADRYIEGHEGRIIWSPKNALGTDLINEKTIINGKSISFENVIKLIISNLKKSAELYVGSELTNCILGRPVYFNDTNSKLDKESEDLLRKIAQEIGFKNIEFEFEPIAAAISYESHLTREELALVVDMGGDTSDFIIMRLSPELSKKSDRKDDILSVDGIHIAGTDFDKVLSISSVMPEFGLNSEFKSMEGKQLQIPSYIFHELATCQKIGFAYTRKKVEDYKNYLATSKSPTRLKRLVNLLVDQRGHELAKKVEETKVKLSDQNNANLEIAMAMK